MLPYFDLSFQHAAPQVLRRMKRFGSTESFLDLLSQARALAPQAGARSNVIVGFPGETEEDLAELERFLTWPGWTWSACSATPTRTAPRPSGSTASSIPTVIAGRVERVATLVNELIDQRAEDRLGESVEVLVEAAEDGEPGRPGSPSGARDRRRRAAGRRRWRAASGRCWCGRS